MSEPRLHRADAPEVGVLLANVGTPRSPAPADVRRFLREFLSDPAVVRANPILWRLVLNGLVLPLRSERAARMYARIWTAEGSPLLAHGRRQRELLAAELGPRFAVEIGMRYGEPGLGSALERLRATGCARLVLLPLFPQSSGTTTGTLLAEVARLIGGAPPAGGLRTVPAFFGAPDYVQALAARIREARIGIEVDHHVFSFHGLPQSYVARGDTYPDQCRETARLLARELGLEGDRWSIAWQSRVGPAAWLRPCVEEHVRSLASRAGSVLVATPGFTADCLETLEEIGMRLRDAFLAAGGRRFVAVPALNDHPTWIRVLARLVHEAADLRPGSPLV